MKFFGFIDLITIFKSFSVSFSSRNLGLKYTIDQVHWQRGGATLTQGERERKVFGTENSQFQHFLWFLVSNLNYGSEVRLLLALVVVVVVAVVVVIVVIAVVDVVVKF